MKRLMISVLMFVSPIVLAEEVLPTGCKAIPIQNELASLSSEMPSLFMIHNISKVDLWITHPVSEPSASAGWSTRLQPDHWSALALKAKTFDLSCIESKPGHEQQVECADVIAVCQWTVAKPPENGSLGTYWAAEDMSLSALSAYLGRRGFKLPERVSD